MIRNLTFRHRQASHPGYRPLRWLALLFGILYPLALSGLIGR